MTGVQSGDSFELSVTPDPYLTVRYAGASGDFNPIHIDEEFAWGPPVVGGDEITTTATVKDISQRGGMEFYVFETVSENQRGDTVCTGTWTNIVRGVGG